MKIKLISSDQNEDYLKAARQNIMDAVGLKPPLYSADPSRHCFYLVAYLDGLSEPVGMAEAFFYDQQFESFDKCTYQQAGDLSKYGQLSDFFHVRSAFVGPQLRGRTSVFPRLLMGLGVLAKNLGATYYTAGTPIEATDMLKLYPRVGVSPLGFFSNGPVTSQLFFGRVDEFIKYPLFESTQKKLEIDWNLAKQVRLCRAFAD